MMLADGSTFTGWWRVLVSESNRQDACRQAVSTAFGPSKISAAGLSWSCQFHVDPLRRSCGLLLWSVAAQKHGSTQRERRISAPRLGKWLYAHDLERWYVALSVYWLYCLQFRLRTFYVSFVKWMANYFVLKQCQILSIYDCYNFSINAMCLVIINSEQIIWKLIAVTQVHVYMICLNKTYAVDHWIKRIYRFYQTFLILLILWLTFLFSLIIIKVELSLNTEQLVDCSIDVLVCDTYICLECVWM